MKPRLLSLWMVLCCAASSAQAAPCEEVGSVDEQSKCLFFAGTQSFRDKKFASAFVHWERLRNLGPLGPRAEGYRVDAYNNLGYLYHTGLGVDADGAKAIAYWTRAFRLGQLESAYHLCHAHADRERPQHYNRQVALRYCKEALHRYRKEEPDADRDNSAIIDQLRRHVARLQSTGGTP